MKKDFAIITVICLVVGLIMTCLIVYGNKERAEYNGLSDLDGVLETTDYLTTISYDIVNGPVYDYKDPETGVHYIIFGNSSKAVSVRYNADGTVYCD